MVGGQIGVRSRKKKSRLTATKGRLGWFKLVDVYKEGLPRQYKEAKLWDWLWLTLVWGGTQIYPEAGT